MEIALANPWPIQPPEKLRGGLAAKIEAAKARVGAYPPEWPAVAWLVKTINGWQCERCEHPHGPIPWTLTVHHLDENKWNLEHWNLAALCQRCHLAVQGRVQFYRAWYLNHTPWMAKHVLEHNEWAAPRGLPLLPLTGIGEAHDFAYYWPRPPIGSAGTPPGPSRQDHHDSREEGVPVDPVGDRLELPLWQ